MANVHIKLNSTPKINDVDTYSDIDLASNNVADTLYDRNAIRNSISNILKWKPYERILNPTFGNSLWNTVFDSFGSLSKEAITGMVKKMLSAEPRINVEAVEVQMDITNSAISIAFMYTIPSLGTVPETYELKISKE